MAISTSEIFAAIICLALVFLFIERKTSIWLRIYGLSKNVPLCEGTPYGKILGHASLFTDVEKFLSVVRKVSEVESSPRILRLGHMINFMITRPEDIELVLNSPHCMTKPYVYDFTLPLEGSGLFNLSGSQWRRHRKLISPTFSQKVLDGFVEVFSEQSEICATQLKKADGKLVNLFEYTTKCFLDGICETAMDFKLNSQIGDSKLAKALEKGMEISMLRMCNFSYHFDFLFNLSNDSRVLWKCIGIYHECIQEMIRKKRAAYEEKVSQNESADCNDVGQRKAFLEILIELTYNINGEDNWSDDELLGEVGNFIAAGSDTAATVTAFAILVLAMHPAVEKKCYEEVISIIGQNRMVTSKDLPKLVYLEKIIKETMRLFPPGPVVMRKAGRDIVIGGYTIPEGASLMIPIIGVHYSEKYYKDPYKFDPERFTPEEIQKRHKYAYIPFSKGPRVCIGMVYGMMSVKTSLAVLLRNFHFETIYDDIRQIRLQQALVIKSVEGFPVRALPRR